MDFQSYIPIMLLHMRQDVSDLCICTLVSGLHPANIVGLKIEIQAHTKKAIGYAGRFHGLYKITFRVSHSGFIDFTSKCYYDNAAVYGTCHARSLFDLILSGCKRKRKFSAASLSILPPVGR